MADKIITIAEYADSMKAELARQLLEDFGIRAVVVDQNAANLGLPSMLAMTAKLQVFESDAARAAEILESAQSVYNVDETGEPEDFEDFDEFGGPEEQEEF